MEQQQKPGSGSVTNIYGNIINYNVYQAPVTYHAPTTNAIESGGKRAEGTEPKVSVPVLRSAIEACQEYIWGSSAYAVMFGVVRDDFGYQDNMSMFERDVQAVGEKMKLRYSCPQGTLASAFSNNPFLKSRSERWESIGVMKRVLCLKAKFTEALAMAIIAQRQMGSAGEGNDEGQVT